MGYNMFLRSGFFLLFLSQIFCGALSAELSDYAYRRIETDLKERHFDRLGRFLRDKIEHSESDFVKIEGIAENVGSQPLLRAIQATRQFKNMGENLLPVGVFLQTALFIETDLKQHIAHGQHYFPKYKTGLSTTVEYDPARRALFIVLDGINDAYLGRGAKKTAYKAIAYNKANPKIVARAEQSADVGRELSITKRLEGARGLLTIDGFGHHSANGKKYTTIYSKLYRSGNLKKAFVNKIQFSTYEKVQIALKVLQGLESMHEKGIVHRDVCAQNIFLNIEPGNNGKRKIDAVIADFGWAHYAGCCNRRKAQANIINTAPEAVFYENLKRSDYFFTDVYAAGLIFYRLIYGCKPSWKKASHMVHTREDLYQKIVDKSREKIEKRKRHLVHMHRSANREFRRLVLRMIDPDPAKRGTAAELVRKMKSILENH